ncbi:hypothetical protein ABMA28_001828 [Loxostege sticticalis]|uniref:Major facilitator superfamily (MFS) profile domain-containing protein n=1 Tax=Loxostege sticticalis TaxID=481309 RepID=A0ABD0T5Q1_LOXSC
MKGLSYGASTVVVPQLRREANSTEAVSEAMASWITSVADFSATIWVIAVTLASHHIGRKKTWLVVAINSCIAYSLFYFSTNVMHIFISQLLLGLTLATQSSLSLMVITEYSSPQYRGVFLVLKSASTLWGMWCANAIGTFFHYKYIGLLGVMCSIYNIISICFIPESPYWLAFKGRYDECRATHRWLKGVDEKSEKELIGIIEAQNLLKKSEHKKHSIKSYLRKYITMVFQPGFYKPVFLCTVVMLMYCCTGKLVFGVYALETMKKIMKDQSTAYIAMLTLDGFSVLGTYLCCILSKFVKRKTILLFAFTIAVMFLSSLSLYVYLVKLNILSVNNYLCIGLFSGYSLAICCGPTIMSGTIAGELYPLKARSFSVCFVAIATKFISGLILKMSPYFFKTFDFHGTALFYSLLSLGFIIFIYKYVPETKDHTLHEIAALFENKTPKETTEMTPLHSLPS